MTHLCNLLLLCGVMAIITTQPTNAKALALESTNFSKEPGI